MSRKVKYMSHLAKRKGRNIAIVLAVVGVKQRRVSGDDRCWSTLAAPELWAFMVSSLAAGPSTARAGLHATGRLTKPEEDGSPAWATTPLRGSQTMRPVEMRTTVDFPLSGERRWIGKRLSGLSH
jgi:hypothetical protein